MLGCRASSSPFSITPKLRWASSARCATDARVSSEQGPRFLQSEIIKAVTKVEGEGVVEPKTQRACFGASERATRKQCARLLLCARASLTHLNGGPDPQTQHIEIIKPPKPNKRWDDKRAGKTICFTALCVVLLLIPTYD